LGAYTCASTFDDQIHSQVSGQYTFLKGIIIYPIKQFHGTTNSCTWSSGRGISTFSLAIKVQAPKIWRALAELGPRTCPQACVIWEYS
jgi:hypothetical protein